MCCDRLTDWVIECDRLITRSHNVRNTVTENSGGSRSLEWGRWKGGDGVCPPQNFKNFVQKSCILVQNFHLFVVSRCIQSVGEAAAPASPLESATDRKKQVTVERNSKKKSAVCRLVVSSHPFPLCFITAIRSLRYSNFKTVSQNRTAETSGHFCILMLPKRDQSLSNIWTVQYARLFSVAYCLTKITQLH